MKHEAFMHMKKDEIFWKIGKDMDPLPLCIEIHPTDFCNQGCVYCFGANKCRGGVEISQRGRYLTLSEYSALFREMKALGIRDVSISGGGEPFLSPDIDGIFDTAYTNNLRIRTVTNGNVLNASTFLKVLRTQEIRFSVDTPDPETYRKMRRVSSQMLQITLDNIKRLVESRDSGKYPLEIGATCIICEDNAEQLEDLAKIMIGQLHVDHLIYKTDIYGKVKPSSMHKIVEGQLDRVSESFKDRIDIRPDLGSFVSGQPCVESHFKSVLNPYGELYSCCLGAQPGETNGIRYGDIKAEIREGNPEPLRTVWERTKHIREIMLNGVSCTDCNFTDREINKAYIFYQNDI